MTTQLQGKVALITGAAQGVGGGIASALASEGASVCIAGRTLKKCETKAQDIIDLGGQAVAVECNVSSLEDLENAVDVTVKELGSLNVVVNNAQFVPLGPLLSIEDKGFEEAFSSGPLATMRLMKLAHPHLKKTSGLIFNILSSVMKRWDVSNYGAYAAVKAATQQLTRAAANEWGKDGIRVNAIMPHAKSPALARWIEKNHEEAEAFAKSIPLGYIGDCTDDIGQFVTHLCKDEARYITGQTIGVDGGQAFIG